MMNSPERVVHLFASYWILWLRELPVSAFPREQAISRRQPNQAISAIETNRLEYR